MLIPKRVTSEINFKRQLEQEEDCELATIVFTFMVLGRSTYCNYPISVCESHYGFDGSQLYPLLWEIVPIVHVKEVCISLNVSDLNKRSFDIKLSRRRSKRERDLTTIVDE